LSIHRTGRDAFAAREWLAADGDARAADDKSLGEGFRCDASACIARLADGRIISQVIAPDAFEEDCARTAIVVTGRDAPPGCQAMAIDRKTSRNGGAIAVKRTGDSFDVTAARPAGQDRPWARSVSQPDEPARPVTRPQSRDATPKAEDLEAGD
jgi:competence protein ComEC